MMSFGWRPNQTCYRVAQQQQPAVTEGASCSIPAWFWLALGVAAIAGLSGKGAR
jgi:hypothetical protein